MTPAAAKPPLDYAPPPRWNRRRWMRAFRWIVLLALLDATVHYGPHFARRIRLALLERQCMRYSAPPGQLVCSEPLPYAGQTPPFSFAVLEPSCLTSLRAVQNDLGTGAAPILFLHERRTSKGKRRLLIVRRAAPADRLSWDIPLSFIATVIDPAFVAADDVKHLRLTETVPNAFGDGVSEEPLLRFFVGQVDSSDDAHFTIQYELREQTETIDGWLTDDLNVRLLQRFSDVPARP